MISDYFNAIALVPLVFLIPKLPVVSRLFRGVSAEKLAYGASTSGILLTFYGIWIGLAGFDAADIEGSIPLLLDGLKTSFGSSIVGLTTSMFINLLFVKKEEVEDDFDRIVNSLSDLNDSLNNFVRNTADANTEALRKSIDKLVNDLEMSLNSETKEVISKFRESVEYLTEWQEKYVDEIKTVTDAMDKNAEVTRATTAQLDKTNDVLDQLGPVTEKIAGSIGWVQKSLPATRKRGFNPEDGPQNEK